MSDLAILGGRDLEVLGDLAQARSCGAAPRCAARAGGCAGCCAVAAARTGTRCGEMWSSGSSSVAGAGATCKAKFQRRRGPRILAATRVGADSYAAVVNTRSGRTADPARCSVSAAAGHASCAATPVSCGSCSRRPQWRRAPRRAPQCCVAARRPGTVAAAAAAAATSCSGGGGSGSSWRWQLVRRPGGASRLAGSWRAAALQPAAAQQAQPMLGPLLPPIPLHMPWEQPPLTYPSLPLPSNRLGHHWPCRQGVRRPVAAYRVRRQLHRLSGAVRRRAAGGRAAPARRAPADGGGRGRCWRLDRVAAAAVRAAVAVPRLLLRHWRHVGLVNTPSCNRDASLAFQGRVQLEQRRVASSPKEGWRAGRAAVRRSVGWLRWGWRQETRSQWSSH